MCSYPDTDIDPKGGEGHHNFCTTLAEVSSNIFSNLCD